MWSCCVLPQTSVDTPVCVHPKATPHSPTLRSTRHYTEAALLVERLTEELLASRPRERRPTLRYIARCASIHLTHMHTRTAATPRSTDRLFNTHAHTHTFTPSIHPSLASSLPAHQTTHPGSASPGSRTTPRQATSTTRSSRPPQPRRGSTSSSWTATWCPDPRSCKRFSRTAWTCTARGTPASPSCSRRRPSPTLAPATPSTTPPRCVRACVFCRVRVSSRVGVCVQW
jgi:hypothetical protein